MTIIKIELDEKEVCEAIAEYVTRQQQWIGHHVNPCSVTLDVGTVHYERGQGSSVAFKKAVVEIKQSKGSNNTDSLDK